jgi:hypothetical protein
MYDGIAGSSWDGCELTLHVLLEGRPDERALARLVNDKNE